MVQCGIKHPARAKHQDVSHFLVRGILAPQVPGQQLEPANIFAGICLLPQGVVILTGYLPWLGPGAEPQHPQVMINRRRVRAPGSQSTKGRTEAMHGVH